MSDFHIVSPRALIYMIGSPQIHANVLIIIHLNVISELGSASGMRNVWEQVLPIKTLDNLDARR